MHDENKSHYIVVTVIIVKDGKYLITKRAAHEKMWPNIWTVPGGKLEKRDYIDRPYDTIGNQWYNVFEDVAAREVLEETNLNIKNLGYVTSLAFIRPDNIPTIVISFCADYDSGEIKLCEDMSDFAWVTLEEAKNYELIDGIWDELKMLDNLLKKGKTDTWKKE